MSETTPPPELGAEGRGWSIAEGVYDPSTLDPVRIEEIATIIENLSRNIEPETLARIQAAYLAIYAVEICLPELTLDEERWKTISKEIGKQSLNLDKYTNSDLKKRIDSFSEAQSLPVLQALRDIFLREMIAREPERTWALGEELVHRIFLEQKTTKR